MNLYQILDAPEETWKSIWDKMITAEEIELIHKLDWLIARVVRLQAYVLSRRDQTDPATHLIAIALQRDRSLVNTPEFVRWAIKNGDKIK